MKTQQEKPSAANRRFHALSPVKKRVAIAKDVIKQLRLKSIKAESDNTYIEINDKTLSSQEDKKFDKLFRDLTISKGKKEVCTVCGKGACMISFVNLGDNYLAGDIPSSNWSILNALKGIFSVRQLDKIEAAFEGLYGGKTFYNKYPDDTKRLRAIMKNIIENNGTFKP